MPEGQIFKATYSGIPVFEMMCKGVAVMRRRADSWLNATQILKVAGFDKPQRTRVLEREVQKGEHEKVQGGYGKYQGTWIPLERGLALAKQYNCEAALRPIIDFQPAAKSPPLAPKHLVSTSTTARPARRTAAAAEAAAALAATARSRRNVEPPVESDHEILSVHASEDGSMTSSPSRGSSSSRTPSPIGNTLDATRDRRSGNRRKPPPRHIDERYDDEGSEEESTQPNGATDPRAYADQILEYFISDSNQVPQVLISPPPDFDPNTAIDDDGHTALHWASAMGRLRIVKLLITAGAEIFKVNKAGQTALMRSVMFANNYDVRKFPELYELLHRSTLNIDNYNRTVFHHIVDVAMSKGKTHAARYYMETVLNRLADYPKELADVINFQDEDGETALTMAARCRSKRLVKLLIDHGANPKIINNDGKSTEDYILEDERFRSSPGPTSRLSSMSFRNAQATLGPTTSNAMTLAYPMNGDKPPLHHSVAAQKASTRCVNDITSMLDSLASSFDRELQEKERDMTQAHALLQNIQQEILESHRAVNQLKTKAEGLQLAKSVLVDLEGRLLEKMGRRYRLGWEKWLNDEEMREMSIRKAADGELRITAATVPYRTDDVIEEVVEPGKDKGKGKRKALPQEEDISDLLALYADVPTDPEAIRAACDALREEIGLHRKRRKDMFDELASFQAEAGTGGRMADYRKLIGAGCGGMQPSEVDNVIGMLLETLESEEPSASSTAWSGSKAGPMS
ncbi:apses-domain-containing protein [Suillus fuscotomentosus]|uniref:Apses-domain-containing protein n=1 Tax=Suillus fuscotomentosus TaxID=1912939 RepID=A0AAD4EJX9_9AGAM|nr:apses-domain-containing protein [Suillus fuscotomentosus]XP_041233683.1 apses-domain-containing protein [Suillus fuscotomentosus]KAG1907505.1 apses-domain-containing protein [Suillus fuscotomentosus]KAG1908108.1 apses-domain-containing protein [Suillus fuscotomentosus]